MSEFTTQLEWKRLGRSFDYETFDRTHLLKFSGGAGLSASSAPEYKGDASLVNPEEQMIAATSSCHMLTFLAIASKSRLTVESYDDRASGVLAKNSDGKLAITEITLRPRVVFSGENIPDATKLRQLHEKAHANCIVANSIRASVVVIDS